MEHLKGNKTTIKFLAKQTGLKEETVSVVLNAFYEYVLNELKTTKLFIWRNFGTFKFRIRTVKNIEYPQVKFKASKNLKAQFK